MDFNRLRSFAAVAEAGHLTRAAEKLHLSQPALSAQIKALEDELDLTLFERTSTGMALTAAGKRLLAEADKILAASQTFEAEARALKGGVGRSHRARRLAGNRRAAVDHAATGEHASPLCGCDVPRARHRAGQADRRRRRGSRELARGLGRRLGADARGRGARESAGGRSLSVAGCAHRYDAP